MSLTLPMMHSRCIPMTFWLASLSMSGAILIGSDSVHSALLQFVMRTMPFLFSGSSNIAEFCSDLHALYLSLFLLAGLILWRFCYRTWPSAMVDEALTTPAGLTELRKISGAYILNPCLVIGATVLLILAIILEEVRGEAPFVALFAPIIALATIAPPILFWHDPSGLKVSTTVVFSLSLMSTLLVLFGFIGFLLQFAFVIFFVLAVRNISINNSGLANVIMRTMKA